MRTTLAKKGTNKGSIQHYARGPGLHNSQGISIKDQINLPLDDLTLARKLRESTEKLISIQ